MDVADVCIKCQSAVNAAGRQEGKKHIERMVALPLSTAAYIACAWGICIRHTYVHLAVSLSLKRSIRKRPPVRTLNLLCFCAYRRECQRFRMRRKQTRYLPAYSRIGKRHNPEQRERHKTTRTVCDLVENVHGGKCLQSSNCIAGNRPRVACDRSVPSIV